MTRVGVFGGTFDPIHCGHLEAATAAQRSLSLDAVLLVPSRTPPHRSVEPRASVFHRFAMAALAAAGPGLMVSDIELRRDGPSYTALTLEALHRDGLSPAQLFFITGSDAFAEVNTWYDYPRIFTLANFAIISRPGAPRASDLLAHTQPPTQADTTIRVVEARTLDVSSTDIRRRVGAGEPIDGLVPPSVADHIRRHCLYGSAPAPAVS